ncbi:hypothetical protein [Sphingopyxis macrogoltabida]|uniref:hypothetical protein n=2 Tax=Sphingopyxis TaxID=165697 RepID=UPI0011AB6DE4|nr:hypothetical protein [Sphingopyxis macrogoltabida]
MTAGADGTGGDAAAAHSRRPDGISEKMISGQRWHRHASPVSFVLLAAVVAIALSGLVGGQPSPLRSQDFGAARLEVKTPSVIRNGEFFETRIRVEATRDISDAVLAVSPSLWTDMTINTMIPAAAEESYKDGAYRFSYGKLRAGETLVVKIDGQINPPLFAGTRGDIALFDGERRLGSMPLQIKVLP